METVSNCNGSFVEDCGFSERFFSKHDRNVVSQINTALFYEKKNSIGTMYSCCILLDKEFNILARGISVCSLLDTYSDIDGLNRAAGRAVKALSNMVTSEPIKNRTSKHIVDRKICDVTGEVFDVGFDTNYPLYIASKNFSSKSEFMPYPTEFEVFLISKYQDLVKYENNR